MAEFLEIQENSEERIRFLLPAIIKKMGRIDLLPLLTRLMDRSGEDPAAVFGIDPDDGRALTLTDLANGQLTDEQYQKLSWLYDHIDAGIRASKEALEEDDFILLDDDFFEVPEYDDSEIEYDHNPPGDYDETYGEDVMQKETTAR